MASYWVPAPFFLRMMAAGRTTARSPSRDSQRASIGVLLSVGVCSFGARSGSGMALAVVEKRAMEM